MVNAIEEAVLRRTSLHFFHTVANKKAKSSLYFVVSTFGFYQCFFYDQAITLIYIHMDHVINKMADTYKKTFPVRLKKTVYRFVMG